MQNNEWIIKFSIALKSTFYYWFKHPFSYWLTGFSCPLIGCLKFKGRWIGHCCTGREQLQWRLQGIYRVFQNYVVNRIIIYFATLFWWTLCVHSFSLSCCPWERYRHSKVSILKFLFLTDPIKINSWNWIFKSHSHKAEGLLLMDCLCMCLCVYDHFRALWLVNIARSQGV